MGVVLIVTAMGGVVLSELRDAEVVSDWTEVTAVPSVLAGSVRRAYPCQGRHAWLTLDLSPFFPKVRIAKGS
jgi:hypothetical protein